MRAGGDPAHVSCTSVLMAIKAPLHSDARKHMSGADRNGPLSLASPHIRSGSERLSETVGRWERDARFRSGTEVLLVI